MTVDISKGTFISKSRSKIENFSAQTIHKFRILFTIQISHVYAFLLGSKLKQISNFAMQNSACLLKRRNNASQ